jgi:HKD family nuclease
MKAQLGSPNQKSSGHAKGTVTNNGTKTIPIPGLLGEGLAAVIGLPPDFELFKSLRESASIRLATAFAHASGWNLISAPILASKGTVHVLAGLHFFQTEPPLLSKWLKETQAENFKCKVVTTHHSKWTFHPKVLIVQGSSGVDFAVVGSGNLSAGGLRGNVECSLFTDNPRLISGLVKWFDHVYENFAERLDEQIIRKYTPLYAKFRPRAKKLGREQSKGLANLDQQIELQKEARLKHWQQAVADAKRFFTEPAFKQEWQELDEASKKIRQCLNYPRFHFGYRQWQEFLRIRRFGNLAALNLYKKKLIKKMDRVQRAFLILTDESKDIRFRLQAVLSGDAKVDGIGINVITKILTIHDRTRWPVYNSRVQGVLTAYGYELPRGLSKADKYLAYATLMGQFVRDTNAKDVYALDGFFLDRTRKNRGRQPNQ